MNDVVNEYGFVILSICGLMGLFVFISYLWGIDEVDKD